MPGSTFPSGTPGPARQQEHPACPQPTLVTGTGSSSAAGNKTHFSPPRKLSSPEGAGVCLRWLLNGWGCARWERCFPQAPCAFETRPAAAGCRWGPRGHGGDTPGCPPRHHGVPLPRGGLRGGLGACVCPFPCPALPCGPSRLFHPFGPPQVCSGTAPPGPPLRSAVPAMTNPTKGRERHLSSRMRSAEANLFLDKSKA